MKSLSFLALALGLLAGSACNNAKASGTSTASAPELHNGRCECSDSDQLCVQHGGEKGAKVSCLTVRDGCQGCGCFTNGQRQCYGSPATSGLCVCFGDTAVSAASVAGAK